MNTDIFPSIRVLVCLADPDRGTELAHALREQGLDVLVAHHIRSAMRVMAKENPHAVIVEVATTAYDGFRVAQWARGRVRAIFLVAERQLTQMEDVEVLSSGARELFYTPLQAETIAASIRSACGAEAPEDAEDFEAEPKTQYSDPTMMLESHSANTVRSVSVIDPSALIDPSAKTEAVQAVRPEDLAAAAGVMDTVTEAQVILPESLNTGGHDTVENAPTLMHGSFAQKPSVDEAPEVAPSPAASVPEELPRSAEHLPSAEGLQPDHGDNSAALVADLFGGSLGPAVIDPARVPSSSFDKGEGAPEEPLIDPLALSEPTEPAPRLDMEEGSAETSAALVDDLLGGFTPPPTPPPNTSTPPHEVSAEERNIESPPDDAFLTAGMLEDLEDFVADALGEPSQPAPPVEAEEQAPEDAPAKEVFEPADIDKQNMPTEHVSGPSTAEFIQAAYGTSTTPKWVAAALLAAVLAATGWVGWLAMERLSTATSSPDVSSASADEETEVRSLLHSTLGDAAISHRSGEIDDAKAHYKKALEQDAENQVALRGLVAIAVKEEDWAQARSSLNALGSIVPDDPMLPLQQGLILNKLGKREAARAELLRFIDSTKPEDPRQALAARVFLSLSDEASP